MIFNISGGGGSGGLNFAVVGALTQPTSPRENTIWVKTETSIPGWVFSPTEPTNPEGGTVFFKTDLTSSVGFNALRKNEIAVLPTAAQQYISGQWKNMEAYAYIGGTWVQFSWSRAYLYNRGDSCNAITGGWKSDNGSSWLTTGTYNINDNGNIYLKGNNSGLWVHTINAVDITAFKTLNAVISYAKGKRNTISVFTPTTSWNMDGDLSRKEISASGTVTLDISALTGPHFIGVGTHSSETGLAEMKVSEVWLS